ncbi:MAG TPA: TadE family protein [Candidatus Limnocylindrales bacterium]|nr:TadE family protein [Candidatus Limnocylindrales bacterium]
MKRFSRGQALVEFALVLPVLILILMALFDFGRAILFYNTISEAARNGARVAIVNQTPADICTTVAGRAAAIGLPAACAPNATAVGVYLTTPSGPGTCAAINCVQTVRVTYQFRAITPIIGNLIGPLTLTTTSSVPVESICLNASCPTT